MARRRTIGSKLRKYVATAKNPDTHETDTWSVWFVSNNRDDRRDWLKMAATAGFTAIKLERTNETK